MIKQEVSKSPTIHVEDSVLEKLEAIRLELKADKVKNNERSYVNYNEVIKHLIKLRRDHANDI
jgi:hypothetical protein